MATEEIMQIVLSVFPSVLTLVTSTGVAAGVVRKFVELKKMVVDMKSIEDLRTDMKKVMQENYELKKQLRETMMKIDHIERK